MANVSRVRGLVPIRHINGAPYNGQGTELLCSDSNTIFIGDAVTYGGSAGAAGAVVSGRNVEGMANIIRTTASATDTAFAGVVVGFIQDQALPVKYAVATATTNQQRIALVETSPDVIYEIQEDGVGANLAATDIGFNTSLITTAGSTVTGLSGMALDSNGTTATTSTLPLKILGLVRRPDNAFGLSTTDLAKFEVIFTQSGLDTGVS